MPRSIAFTKMHGLGNDYIYVDCLKQQLNGVDRPALSRAVSDRHRGIGADGLILISPPNAGVNADCRMEMYNADGSRGEMCGNGIRCVAKYVLDHGVIDQSRDRKGAPRAANSHSDSPTAETSLRVETDRGVLELRSTRDECGKVISVRVNMGPPILRPQDIPVALDGDKCVRHPLQVGDKQREMTCVSMGNPHAVFFVPSLEAIDLKEIGPRIERHALFPNRVNVHIVQTQSRREATMKTWERGTGLTQACGTGACAVLVAGVLEDRLDRAALIHLPGGDLGIEWEEVSNAVFMTGPATEIFSGQWPLETHD